MTLKIKVLAELIGTALLLMVVVGSGIMGETLSHGNTAIALLANSLATGFGLFVLIQCLQPISGAHFNPAVTAYFYLRKSVDRKTLALYWIAQFLGAMIGVCIAHVMFAQSVFQISAKQRVGIHLGLSEFIATFGLICVIALAGRKRSEMIPVSVAAYIAAAYWFTSSTSFANPAVTVARTFTDTFCGIAPDGILMFVAGQIVAVFVVSRFKLPTG